MVSSISSLLIERFSDDLERTKTEDDTQTNRRGDRGRETAQYFVLTCIYSSLLVSTIPHYSMKSRYENANFWKPLQSGKFFKRRLAYSCRMKTELFENCWRHGSCSEHGGQARDLWIIFLGPLVKSVACLEIQVCYVQAQHMRINWTYQGYFQRKKSSRFQIYPALGQGHFHPSVQPSIHSCAYSGFYNLLRVQVCPSLNHWRPWVHENVSHE